MATDEEKGLVGSATDSLRETTGALKGEGPLVLDQLGGLPQQPKLPDR